MITLFKNKRCIFFLSSPYRHVKHFKIRRMPMWNTDVMVINLLFFSLSLHLNYTRISFIGLRDNKILFSYIWSI